MTALRFFETYENAPNYQPTLGGNQEVLNPQQHNCEDLKSRRVIVHRAHKGGKFLDQIKEDMPFKRIYSTEAVIPLLNVS
jgi:hypothetical protein